MLEKYIEEPKDTLERLNKCKTEFETLREKYTESRIKISNEFCNTLKELLLNKWIRFESRSSNGVSIKGYYLSNIHNSATTRQAEMT